MLKYNIFDWLVFEQKIKTNIILTINLFAETYLKYSLEWLFILRSHVSLGCPMYRYSLSTKCSQVGTHKVFFHLYILG